MEQPKKWSEGAWLTETTKGTVINFKIDGQRYSMWHNKEKKTDKSPDFTIYKNDFTPTTRAKQFESKPIQDDTGSQRFEKLSNDDLPF